MVKKVATSFNICDIDDFYEGHTGWEYLKRIKEHIPRFRATLFTVIGKCSSDFIDKYKKINWLDLVPHGWLHHTPTECINWSYEESIDYLKKVEKYNLTKGFKAPGWQISNGMYQALLERDYWVADQPYNNNRRPKNLKAYILDSPNKHHFHVQNVCGNGLEESLDKILSLKGNFKLIKEIL